MHRKLSTTYIKIKQKSFNFLVFIFNFSSNIEENFINLIYIYEFNFKIEKIYITTPCVYM